MTGMLDQVFAQIGSGRLPTVVGMIEQIKVNGGNTEIGSLYTRLYDPLSTLYIHSGSLGLLRHVHTKTQRTRERPYSAWSIRSAIHTADGMVGLLACTIAGKDHADFALFSEYKTAHLRITWTPLTFIVRGLLITRIDFRQLPAIAHIIWLLISKSKTGASFTETDIDKLRAILKRLSRVETYEDAVTPVIDALKTKLLLSRPDDENSPGGSH